MTYIVVVFIQAAEQADKGKARAAQESLPHKINIFKTVVHSRPRTAIFTCFEFSRRADAYRC